MDYSSCPKREIWPFLNGSHISEVGGVTPTKTGVHARDIDPYLHELSIPTYMNFLSRFRSFIIILFHYGKI